MPEPEQFRRGREFEAKVRTDLALNSNDGVVNSNYHIDLRALENARQRHGFADICITELDDFVTIIEIKSTDWDRIKPKNVTKNLWRHQNQLFKYVDRFVDVDGINVCLGIIYPKPPEDADLRARIEAYLDEYGAPAYWYTEIETKT